MTITRADIRHAMLDFNLWRGTGYFAVSDSDVGWVEAAFGQGGDSLAKFINRYLYAPAAVAEADRLRRVREFKPQQRRVYHAGPNWSVAPAADAFVEMWTFDPVEFVNAAIDRALTRRCFKVIRTDIVTNGSGVYTIGTSPFDPLAEITDADDQILDIEQIDDATDATMNQVAPWDTGGRSYYGERNDDVLTVRFSPPPSGTIRVIWKEPYSALATEATTTTCPLQYVAWGAILELFVALEKRAINHAESQTQFGAMKKSADDSFQHEHVMALSGRYAYRQRRRRRTRRYAPAPPHGIRGYR